MQEKKNISSFHVMWPSDSGPVQSYTTTFHKPDRPGFQSFLSFLFFLIFSAGFNILSTLFSTSCDRVTTRETWNTVDFSASSNLYSFFRLKPIIVHLSAWLLYVWGYKLITFPFIFTRKYLSNEIHIRCVPNLKPLYKCAVQNCVWKQMDNLQPQQAKLP